MEKIAVITDSCADIPPELVREYGIFVLPLIIRARGREYRDGVDITAEDIYKILKTETPKTSLPSGEDALALLRWLRMSGYTHVIAVMLSSGLSGTSNMLRIIAQQVPELEVQVCDSLSGSIGCGITAIEVAEDVRRGKSFREIAARIPSLTPAAKSKSPGQSMRFTLLSFHSRGATAEATDTLRLISSGSQSQTVLPSAVFPSRSVAPAR